jgi:hypothetical protein
MPVLATRRNQVSHIKVFLCFFCCLHWFHDNWKTEREMAHTDTRLACGVQNSIHTRFYYKTM